MTFSGSQSDYEEGLISKKGAENLGIYDVDWEMQIQFSEGLTNENDCMWLSSSNMSDSFPSSDDLLSLDSLEIALCDMLLHHQPAPERMQNRLGDILQDWLLWHTIYGENGITYPSMEEEPKCCRGTFTALDQDFTLLTYLKRQNLHTRSSILSGNQTADNFLDIQTLIGYTNYILEVRTFLKDSETEEPLFWPFDRKSYWSLELKWNFSGIPHGEGSSNSRSPARYHSSNLVQLRVHQNDSPNRKKANLEYAWRAAPPASTSPRPVLTHRRTTDSRRQVSHTINRNRRSSLKTGVRGHHRTTSTRRKHALYQGTSLCQHMWDFDAEDFEIYLDGGIPIEVLIGLNEFNGLEGGLEGRS